MNKVLLHAVVCALLAAASLRAEEPKKPVDAPKAEGPKVDLKTDKDIASYALGLNYGSGAKQQFGDDIDYVAMAAAFKDAINGVESKMTPEDAAKCRAQFMEFAKKKQAGDKAVVLENKAGVSALLGQNVGSKLSVAKDVLNTELTVQAFISGTKGENGGFDVAANQEKIQKYLQGAQESIMAKAKESGVKNQKDGEAFLADNKKKDGVKVTPSGLQYKILSEGKGEIPKATDKVNARYEGRLISGKVFDSTAKHGTQSDNFPVMGVIPGWTEALKMMPVGSKWELYIPSNLAYGENGSPPDIQPGHTLIFTIELVSIDKVEEPAAAPKLLPTAPVEKK